MATIGGTSTSLDFPISTSFDPKGVDEAMAHLDALKAQLKDLASERVELELASTDAEATIAKLEAEIKALKATIPVELTGDGAAEAKLTDLKAELADIKDKKIALDVEATHAEAQIAVVRSAIDHMQDKIITLRADDSDALAKANAVRAAEDSLHDKTIHIDVDRTGIANDISDIGRVASSSDNAAHSLKGMGDEANSSYKGVDQLGRSSNDTDGRMRAWGSSVEDLTSHLDGMKGSGDGADRTIKDLGNSSSSSGGFVGFLGSAFGLLGTVVSSTLLPMTVIVAIIAAAGPIAALTAGILIGTLGVAFIGLGALALKGVTSVSDEFKQFGEDLKVNAANAADGMKAPLIAGLKELDTGFKQLVPVLSVAFTAAGKLIQPFVQSLLSFANMVMPGVIAALKAAGPVIDGLRQGMGELGAGISAMFEGLAKGAAGAGAALSTLFGFFGQLLGILGQTFGEMAGPGARALAGLASGLLALIQGGMSGFIIAVNEMDGVLGPFLQLLGQTAGTILKALIPVIAQFMTDIMQGLTPALKALMPAITSLGQTLGQIAVALAPVIALVGQLAASLISALVPVIGTLLKALVPVISALVTGLAPVIKALIPVLVTVVDAVAKLLVILAPLAPAILQVVAALVVALTPSFNALVKALIPLVTSLMPPLVAFVKSLVPVIQAVAPLLSQLLVPLFNALGQAFIQMEPSLVKLVPLIGVEMTKAIQKIAPMLPQLIDAFVKLVLAVIPLIPAIVKLLPSLLQFSIDLTTLFIAALPIIAPLIQIAAILVGGLATGLAAAVRGVTQFTDTLPQILGWVGQTQGALGGWVSKTVGQFGGWVSQTVGLIAGWVAQTVGQFGGWVSQTVGQIAGWVAQTVGQIAGWVAQTVGQIAGWVAQTVGQIAGWVAQTVGQIAGWVAQTVGQIAGWVVKTIGQIGGWVSQFTSKMASWSSTVLGQFATWGAGVLSFFSGLMPKIGTIWDTLKTIVATPVNFVIGVWDVVSKAVGLPTIPPIPNEPGFFKLAEGGPVPMMPGAKRGEDSVLALLMPDEHVLSVEQTRKLGGHKGVGELLASIPHKAGGDTGAGATGATSTGGAQGAGAGNPTVVATNLPGSGVFDSITSAVAGPLKKLTASILGTVVYDIAKPILDAIVGAVPNPVAGLPVDGVGGVPHAGAAMVEKGVLSVLKSKQDAAVAAAAVIGGAIPAGNHLAVIDAALAAAGVPPPDTKPQWEAGMNTLITRESAWDPNAINNTDSNAAAGIPSQGLAQVIPPTFAAYHVAGTSSNILDPVANVAAAIRYIVATYGSITNVQQANANLPPKGYDMGGPLLPGLTYVNNSTGSVEGILNPTGMRSIGGLTGLGRLNSGGHSGNSEPPVYVNVENNWYGNPSPEAVDNATTGMADKLRVALTAGTGKRAS